MFLVFSLAAAIAAAPSPPAVHPDVDRAAIRHVVSQRNASARVDAIIVHGDYAIASGTSSGGALINGLHLATSGWQVVCNFESPPSPSELTDRCGFPIAVSNELAANEAAQASVQKGDFAHAATSEKKAYASAQGPDKDQEAARAQYLAQLNEQMRTGAITRQQGIQAWSQFRYSFMLP